MSLFCPLCNSTDLKLIDSGEGREYFQCGECSLVHVPFEYHLPKAQEKAVYDQHQNSPYDSRYRAFLDQLLLPLVSRLNPGASGLDFGSGPGPTVSVILEERGYKMEIYDKFYADNPAVLTKNYDFITTTEVVEHLARPGEILNWLWEMINPKGCLGIMTRLLPGTSEEFSSWHYKRDPTHISFFAEQSLVWLAEKWQAKLSRYENVAIFEKMLIKH